MSADRDQSDIAADPEVIVIFIAIPGNIDALALNRHDVGYIAFIFRMEMLLSVV